MDKMTDKPTTEFTLLSFLWRFLASLALVLITFNPSGYSAYHLIVNAISAGEFGPLHFLLIISLLIGWGILLMATKRAMDTVGVVLASLLLAGIVWLLIDIGVLAANSVSSITWIVLVCLAGVLAVGLSWSHIWRRMTGQVNVDDVDE